MICILSLIVFSFLGIFSARYRKLAAEAFDCVFRKITLRKCQSGLDVRVKSQITGKLMRFNRKFAKKVYKHFELISWIFVIIFLASFVYLLIGGYNFYMYGNCNGPNDDGFCIFDPTGGNSKVSTINDGTCGATPQSPGLLTLFDVDLNVFSTDDRNADNTVFIIGCYFCEYTRHAYPDLMKLIDRDDVNVIFAHFPVKQVQSNLTNILNCLEGDEFLEFNKNIFESKIENITNDEYVFNLLENQGVDTEKVKTCISSPETKELYDTQLSQLNKIGVYGTPTVFVNGIAVVGPKPYRVYKRLLK